ncbi:MAG: DUF1007 family protein [Thiolinea sp.]
MNKFCRMLPGCLLAGLFCFQTALAGGVHYKVNTSTSFYSDNAANLAGVRMNWVYDPEVSAYIIEGRDTSEDGLQQLAEDMIADLHELGYFTQFMLDGAPLPVEKVTEFSIKLTSENRLQLGLQLPLQQAIDVSDKTIALTLADPDGTADMVYSGAERITLGEALAEKCSQPELQSELVDAGGHQLTIQTASIACQ